ncbi:transcriptional repressor [Acuticoccus sediminis]|uniref:Ferric uptake regulation protein n=1 Tax=Acuticoccus sediminis TaxID=2184697 RepID=A0A8B2NMA2_9HYPH|nr:transcriptional repressor [Acuticoccus sediminis]RAI00757.1 transcriptional repressor [Acuticoccus sediminis]
MLAFYTKTPTDPSARQSAVRDLLTAAGLKATRQRMGLACLLFGGPHRHFTAEELHHEALSARMPVSLATIYNSLRLFCDAGLVRSVVVDPSRAYFDTNVSDHFHFFNEEDGAIYDVPDGALDAPVVPQPPDGYVIERVDVVVRLRRRDSQQ